MKRVTWWRLVLAVVFPLLLSRAPVSAQEGRAENPEIQEKAMSALKRMITVLSQAKQFSFTSEVGFDVMQDWGQKVEFGETRTVTVRRPDHARIDVTKRDGAQSGFVFDGKEITVFDIQENVYATVAKPGTLDDAITHVVNDLDMRLPLAEMMSSRLPQIASERVRAARYVEQSTIAGISCDHLALRSDRVDLQLWIAQGDQPLLQRLVITYTHAEGQPQFWAQFREWQLTPEVPDSLFTFTPPEGAAKIAFAPRRSSSAARMETKGGQP
ncbi:MAG TPA: DUF2092 domain-containing protein [Candidatus Binatia bacterium]|jgi:hypothetical protein|nr:DUF2092 domain-containing protein [Candidatus Binatia bacterium]